MLSVNYLHFEIFETSCEGFYQSVAFSTMWFLIHRQTESYIIARLSAIECVAILDLLTAEKVITVEMYNNFYSKAE